MSIGIYRYRIDRPWLRCTPRQGASLQTLLCTHLDLSALGIHTSYFDMKHYALPEAKPDMHL